MQRIADNFTSIRQEMERIEAERGGGRPEPIEVKVLGGGSEFFKGPSFSSPVTVNVTHQVALARQYLTSQRQIAQQFAKLMKIGR